MKVAPSPLEMIQREMIGICNIKIGSSPLIEHVVLLDRLIHNLLSINQLCDNLRVIFDNSSCDVLDKKLNSFVLSSFL